MAAVKLLPITALVLCGCFGKPGFTPGDGGGSDGGDGGGTGSVPSVSVTAQPKLEIRAAEYTLTFEQGDWLMPDGLHVPPSSNEERLGFDQEFDEDALGVSLNFTYTVNAASTFRGSGMLRQITATGPVKAVVEVTWSGPAHCTGGTMLTGNKSTFTFYPDRIVRNDVVNTEQACSEILGVNATLAWPAGAVGSYYDNAGLRRTLGSPPSSADYVNTGKRRMGAACLQHQGSAIAMTWQPPAVDDEWEFIEAQLGTTTLGILYVFAENLDAKPLHRYEASTALAIRGANATCETLEPLAMTSLQSPPTLQNATFRSADGVYVLAGPGSAEALSTLPPGFAVEYATTASGVSIARESASADRRRTLIADADYGVQRDGNLFTLFMVDTLLAGERLVVSDQ